MKQTKNARMEKLAMELIDLLIEHDMYIDVTIYVNNEMWSATRGRNDIERHTPKQNTFFVTDNVDVSKRIEYANPDTITLTFEGPLYTALNYYDQSHIRDRLDKLFLRYHLYAEQGHAWSMALYPV